MYLVIREDICWFSSGYRFQEHDKNYISPFPRANFLHTNVHITLVQRGMVNVRGYMITTISIVKSLNHSLKRGCLFNAFTVDLSTVLPRPTKLNVIMTILRVKYRRNRTKIERAVNTDNTQMIVETYFIFVKLQPY